MSLYEIASYIIVTAVGTPTGIMLFKHFSKIWLAAHLAKIPDIKEYTIGKEIKVVKTDKNLEPTLAGNQEEETKLKKVGA